MLYARVALRLTLASGGIGRYGLVWGIWHRAQLTPGLGYYQPDFQCAEYVMRSLRAAGYNIATPPPTAAAWVNLVNVDRAVQYLMARGIARPAPLARLVVGDAVLFHYLRNGPDNWSHIALVQGVRPLRLSAHDRNRWAAPLPTLPPAEAVLGLHTVAKPTPPSGLEPLNGATWGEIALRDPPLRVRPSGRAGRRLYLGQIVHLSAVARAAGSITGWLQVESGPLGGWINGDAVTRLAAPPPLTAPGLPLLGVGRPRVAPGPLPIRGAWGRRLYVDADGCPMPPWTSGRCSAPYVPLAAPRYPAYRVSAPKPVPLSLRPVPGGLVVSRLLPGQSVAAERLGRYAVLFGLGGPAAGGGVLYAPAGALDWSPGGIYEFLRPVAYGSSTVPAATAAAVTRQGLSALFAAFAPPPPSLPCVTWLPGRPLPGASAAGGPACLYVPPPRAGAPAPADRLRAREAVFTFP